jgi:hypothetical protein
MMKRCEIGSPSIIPIQVSASDIEMLRRLSQIRHKNGRIADWVWPLDANQCLAMIRTGCLIVATRTLRSLHGSRYVTWRRQQREEEKRRKAAAAFAVEEEAR